MTTPDVCDGRAGLAANEAHVRSGEQSPTARNRLDESVAGRRHYVTRLALTMLVEPPSVRASFAAQQSFGPRGRGGPQYRVLKVTAFPGNFLMALIEEERHGRRNRHCARKSQGMECSRSQWCRQIL